MRIFYVVFLKISFFGVSVMPGFILLQMKLSDRLGNTALCWLLTSGHLSLLWWERSWCSLPLPGHFSGDCSSLQQIPTGFVALKWYRKSRDEFHHDATPSPAVLMHLWLWPNCWSGEVNLLPRLALLCTSRYSLISSTWYIITKVKGEANLWWWYLANKFLLAPCFIL